jgi:prolyl-tRNA synthetase
MRLSKLIGKRVKETPKDAELTSHIFLLRGGYVRQVGAGLFTLLPLGKRITTKIENIIRKEMNRIDGQEILMPVVLPRELWDETGRFESIGKELLRFKDRSNKDLVLGMTHEEAVMHAARTEATSYKQLPFMLYQIQTKFRDEARSRGGLIRVREFTMKDAYSYHTSQDDLEDYYQIAFDSYVNIFKRAGLTNCISVESDSGMMGGSISHEFMAICDAGEDTIIICDSCTYKANKEVATSIIDSHKEKVLELEEVHTPNCESIEDVAAFLKVPTHNTAKAFFAKGKEEGKLVFAIIRGDIEVNEAKLKAVAGLPSIEFATDEEISKIGAVPGFASTLNTDLTNVELIIDNSVTTSNNLVCGANKVDYHVKNFNFSREIEGKIKDYKVADIASVREGDKCPKCEAKLSLKRGIEVGNIFQLGTKYTKSMNHTYLDENGKAQHPIMGCYGIGVGRLMASVIENHHDKFGPQWPITIAPFELHLNALNYKKVEVMKASDQLYKDLKSAGIDVVFDDSDNKAGFQFNDADLIGAPFRVIVSPKTLEQKSVEFKVRGSKDGTMLKLDDCVDILKDKISKAYKEYE